MSMSANLYYKQKRDYDESLNLIKFGLMSYVMHAGAEVVSIGELHGLYTKTTTYFLSDGSSYSFVARNKFMPIGGIKIWD